MKNIHVEILDRIKAGQAFVLATVVRTSGSTPQKPGSSAIFGGSGLIAGTIGGGQLEGEVEKLALSALKSKSSGIYHFNHNTGLHEGGSICGGKSEILLDANPGKHRSIFEIVAKELSEGKAGKICTITKGKPGEDFSIERKWVGERDPGPSPEIDPDSLFLESFRATPKLIIAGAGHVGKALSHLAGLLDFKITMIDDRKDFACKDHIPEADHFVVKDIGKAISEAKIDAATYIVIVTRDHTNDALALEACLTSQAAYVGMIGSKRKVARIKENFLKKGLATEEQWSKIYTPIGLNIGSQSVQEIALSIAAQLVSVRSKTQVGHA